MKKLIFMLMILSGCTTSAPGEYNSKHKQDPDCYKSTGGQEGYCDRPWWKDGIDITK